MLKKTHVTSNCRRANILQFNENSIAEKVIILEIPYANAFVVTSAT
jgi:hypothetical protein